MIDWNVCKDIFEWDGGLRDIYITSASIADWQAIYPFLCSFPDVTYFVSGAPEPLPNDVAQIFQSTQLDTVSLRIKIGRMHIHFHFFTENEIECDLDSREISSQAELDNLLGFMRGMGDLVHKLVMLTYENCSEEPQISYNPQTRNFHRHSVA